MFFLKLATGEHTLKQICQQANLEINENNLHQIHELYYVTLYPAGVLEKENTEIKKNKSFINFGFTILNQQKVVFLSDKLKSLFEKKMVLILLSLSLCILLYTIVLYFEGTNNITLTHLDNPIWVGLLLIPIFFMHELGHSSALSYFGETPNKIGIGLYLLAPVLYADVTDAWKLNRKQRMVVDLGGLYFQFIFSCFYLLLFVILNNAVLFYTVIFSFIIGIFNLNPFIKMVGYWFVSDYLNILNLKDEAKNRTLSVLRYLMSRKNNSYEKQDIYFMLYHILNSIFKIAFIMYILLWHIELFTNFPQNLKKIILMFYECNYDNINLETVELIVFPSVVIFLVSNAIIKYIRK